MPRSSLKPRPPKSRRWRVPPAVRVGADRPTGAEVLCDDAGVLGSVLWRTVRAVHLWAAVTPEERRSLFSPEAERARLAEILAAAPEPALEAPLILLAGMLGQPQQVHPEQVALACARIAAWARQRGAPGVCAEFTHAATYACPGNPVYALASARMSRDRGAYVEAETAYQRAVALGRQTEDWDSYTRAWAGLGKTAQAKGAYPTARKSLLKALRAAERRGFCELRARVLHDLFTVEMECDRYEEAEEYAEASLHVYGAGHENLPRLAGDIAILRLDQGRFKEALKILLRILPHLQTEARVMALGNIARAAGAVGEQVEYETAFFQISAAPKEDPRRADALRDAAQGAISLGRLDDAENTAREALTVACTRGDNKTIFEVETILERVQRLRHASMRGVEQVLVTEGTNITYNSPLSEALDRMLPIQPAGI